jgi:hypothetical protein
MTSPHTRAGVTLAVSPGWRSEINLLLVFIAVLGIIAALSPPPWNLTDREEYERVGQEMLIRGCSSLHCFRKLVPIVIEHLPGASVITWKGYAVAANAVAAVAVRRVALAFGLSPGAALVAALLTLVGYGSLYTLFDPHTADPLMFALGPVLTLLLLRDRLPLAATIAAIGIFAKEFAAAPLWMAAWADARARRWSSTVRVAVAALSVTTLWIVFQVTLMVAFDYSYGGNPSSRIFGGGYLAHWLNILGPRAALVALFTSYGAMYLLVPVGFALAPMRLRHWAIACLPALVAFGYVQQPDRAIWNFHFIATPLAALALTRLPWPAVAVFVGAYGAANLRIGAQLPWLAGARFFVLVASLIAIAALVRCFRDRGAFPVAEPPRLTERPFSWRDRRRAIRLGVLDTLLLILVGVVMLDVALHDPAHRFNKWGYRGPVLATKRPGELRLAVVGGEIVFGSAVDSEGTISHFLARNMRQGWRTRHLSAPVTVANLGVPRDVVTSLPTTLDDFAYLEPDLVVIVTDLVAAPKDGTATPGWRRQSLVFRATGYLPMLTRSWWDKPLADTEIADTAVFCDSVLRTVDAGVRAGRKVLVATAPYRTAADRNRASALLAALQQRYGGEPRVAWVDIGAAINFDRFAANDNESLTAHGHAEIAEYLTETALELAGR